jgi:hypothetical protein
MTRPCECGLRGPERLSGFTVRAVGGAPSSDTVSQDPGRHGPRPPTYPDPSYSRAGSERYKVAPAVAACQRLRGSASALELANWTFGRIVNNAVAPPAAATGERPSGPRPGWSRFPARHDAALWWSGALHPRLRRDGQTTARRPEASVSAEDGAGQGRPAVAGGCAALERYRSTTTGRGRSLRRRALLDQPVLASSKPPAEPALPRGSSALLIHRRLGHRRAEDIWLPSSGQPTSA